MEIPYTTKARPDTGLWNSKIGIWLFLASEVMLFGGLFSSYVFLRLGAAQTPGYDWPMHVLSVPPGFINTMVLIASSVTVILAWASIKLRDWKMFQLYMSITLLCSLGFMGIKSYEYYGKLTHYGVFLTDGSVITGHDIEVSETTISIVPDAKQHSDKGHGAEEEKPKEAIAPLIDPATVQAAADAHKPLVIPREQVFRWSNHGPAYNTFYAIYFTLTGLHALHVVGGALVLAYFLFFGKKMYDAAPEHLANRVEVGGLFWHFVDLVWIFLFPLLYLL